VAGVGGVLAAALLFNLGQGVPRPSLPSYLQQVSAANYLVMLIPLVFGLGKWVASLPTGYLLDRLRAPTIDGGGPAGDCGLRCGQRDDLDLRRLPGRPHPFSSLGHS
jgi:MFS family permease